MASRSLVRGFLVLYLTLGVVVLVQSVQTVLAAERGEIAGPDRLRALLPGGLEAAAVLLVIFAIAFGLHAARADLHLTLLVYAAGVLFVWIHGVKDYPWNGAT